MPVYNEEAALDGSIRRLHRYLAARSRSAWRIVIADNASTDATPGDRAGARRELRGVELLRLDAKGRGRALRAAWSRSDARVVAYMDVDLSTDLRALLPLVAPLLSGHSDLAIGTRLARSARGRARAQARAHLALLQPCCCTPRCARASPTPSAASRRRADAALRGCSTTSRDDGWFFDTELLVLAQRRGLRIHEVPVDWVDDPDSRVDIVRTALERPARRRAAGGRRAGGRASWASACCPRSPTRCSTSSCTARSAPAAANAAALALTAVANTAANRRLTFGVRGRDGLAAPARARGASSSSSPSG